MGENTSAPVIDESLLHATIKWNTLLFAGICGFSGALTLLFITYISLHRGLPYPGYYLNLLGVFLPGYAVSTGGAWVGFLWGGLVGAISGAVLYRVYALSIRQQVADYFAGEKSSDDLEYVTMKIYGHALGLAMGSIAALGLLISTNWLVVRGTAEESIHAGLLSHFLPGYSVSASGSILGAIGIFVITYLFCIVLGAIYNGVVAFRKTGTET
jgi:hypothetical protein